MPSHEPPGQPRIASLQPSVSITLEALGRLDTLVACTKYCVDAVPALKALPVRVVRDSWSASTEEILAAQPTLVIASVPYRMESLAAILKTGCTVVALAPHRLDDIYKDIRLLGNLVDRVGAAEVLVRSMREEIDRVVGRVGDHVGDQVRDHVGDQVRDHVGDQVRDHVGDHVVDRVGDQAGVFPFPTQDRPLVHCEEWGKPLIHSQPWVAELIEAAGGRFLGTPGATTDAQAVVTANPDVVICSWCGAGDRVPLERVVSQRDWHGLRAVQQRRVYCIPDEWLNTPAPTLIRGLHALAAAIHPEVFVTTQPPRRLQEES